MGFSGWNTTQCQQCIHHRPYRSGCNCHWLSRTFNTQVSCHDCRRLLWHPRGLQIKYSFSKTRWRAQVQAQEVAQGYVLADVLAWPMEVYKEVQVNRYLSLLLVLMIWDSQPSVNLLRKICLLLLSHNKRQLTLRHFTRRYSTFNSDIVWGLYTPSCIPCGVRTDFFISFYLCECARSPYRVHMESE